MRFFYKLSRRENILNKIKKKKKRKEEKRDEKLFSRNSYISVIPFKRFITL